MSSIEKVLKFNCESGVTYQKLHFDTKTRKASVASSSGNNGHDDAGVLKSVTMGDITLQAWQWWLLEFCEYLNEFCERLFINNDPWEAIISDINHKQPRIPFDQRTYEEKPL